MRERPGPYDLGAQARDDAERRANPNGWGLARLEERVQRLEGRIAKLEAALAARDAKEE
jgi:hypothetical protein